MPFTQVDPYESYGLTWSICLNYIYGLSWSIQTIWINHEIAHLQRGVILELTKNVGCTSNKAGAPSITQKRVMLLDLLIV